MRPEQRPPSWHATDRARCPARAARASEDVAGPWRPQLCAVWTSVLDASPGSPHDMHQPECEEQGTCDERDDARPAPCLEREATQKPADAVTRVVGGKVQCQRFGATPDRATADVSARGRVGAEEPGRNQHQTAEDEG